MAGRNPVVAHAAPGLVLLLLDVDTAVAVADAAEFAIASGGLTTVGRPLAHADVEKVRDAAATAAAEADGLDVDLATAPVRPVLTVLAGGESRC